jgi:hypothetical protein
MQFYNTLDLDECTKEQLQQTETKIKSNPCCLSITHKDSSSKGYHVIIICSKQCDLCRFVFDDVKRYEIDLGREQKFQNTIFTEKEWFRGNMKSMKLKCERCEKHHITTTLSYRELTLEETKKKVRIGQIKGYPSELIYLGYNYFECPICHWFKFVKKDSIPNAIEDIEGKK